MTKKLLLLLAGLFTVLMSISQAAPGPGPVPVPLPLPATLGGNVPALGQALKLYFYCDSYCGNGDSNILGQYQGGVFTPATPCVNPCATGTSGNISTATQFFTSGRVSRPPNTQNLSVSGADISVGMTPNSTAYTIPSGNPYYISPNLNSFQTLIGNLRKGGGSAVVLINAGSNDGQAGFSCGTITSAIDAVLGSQPTATSAGTYGLLNLGQGYPPVIVVYPTIIPRGASINASISGTTLTLNSIQPGNSLAPLTGALLEDTTGVLTPGTVLVSGSGSTWQVSPSQSVSSENMIASSFTANEERVRNCVNDHIRSLVGKPGYNGFYPVDLDPIVTTNGAIDWGCLVDNTHPSTACGMLIAQSIANIINQVAPQVLQPGNSPNDLINATYNPYGSWLTASGFFGSGGTNVSNACSGTIAAGTGIDAHSQVSSIGCAVTVNGDGSETITVTTPSPPYSGGSPPRITVFFPGLSLSGVQLNVPYQFGVWETISGTVQSVFAVDPFFGCASGGPTDYEGWSSNSAYPVPSTGLPIQPILVSTPAFKFTSPPSGCSANINIDLIPGGGTATAVIKLAGPFLKQVLN